MCYVYPSALLISIPSHDDMPYLYIIARIISPFVAIKNYLSNYLDDHFHQMLDAGAMSLVHSIFQDVVIKRKQLTLETMLQSCQYQANPQERTHWADLQQQ